MSAATIWSKGTDLRNKDGIYCWPHPNIECADEDRKYYISVTTTLNLINGDMKFAENWFFAEYIKEIALAAKEKQLIKIWHKGEAEMIEVRPIDVLLSSLDEAFWGKNAAMHWMKSAGGREMQRRSLRGAIVHDAIEEWALQERRIGESDLYDYTLSLIKAPRTGYDEGLTIAPEFCMEFVREAIKWCDEHIDEVHMCEACLMHDDDGWAGTGDLVCTLRGYPGISKGEPILVDAKNSKAPQKSHRLQLATYRKAQWIGIKNTAMRVPFEAPERVFNLYIQPEGCSLKEWFDLEDAYAAFLHLCMVFHDIEGKHSPFTLRAPKLLHPTSAQLKLITGDE